MSDEHEARIRVLEYATKIALAALTDWMNRPAATEAYDAAQVAVAELQAVLQPYLHIERCIFNMHRQSVSDGREDAK